MDALVNQWHMLVLISFAVQMGAPAQVSEYMETFNRYSFLWKEDLQAAYERFMKSNPTLEAFEAELKKWVWLEV